MFDVFCIDFVYEDVSCRVRNRFVEYEFVEEAVCVRVSVFQYGFYYFKKRHLCKSYFKSLYLDHNSVKVRELFAIRLYYSNYFYPASNFVRASANSSLFLINKYDFIIFISSEHSFHVYLKSLLIRSKFRVDKFSRFSFLFSSLYFCGFSEIQRVVFNDTLKLICVFRYYIDYLITKYSLFSTYFSKLTFLKHPAKREIIDFCVSFFISIISVSDIDDLFINFCYKEGRIKFDVKPVFYDVCLEFFNVTM